MLLRLSICLITLLVSTTKLSFSQLYTVQLPPGNNKILTEEPTPGVVGSPYLQDGWSKGSVNTSNGKIIDNLNLRYDVYKKEIQFQADNKIYILSSPDSLNSVIIGSRRFIYLSFKDKKTMQKDYFEELSPVNKSQLLMRHTVRIIKSNYNKALNVGNKDDRFEHRSYYYIRKGNVIALIDKKGNSFFTLFAESSQELKKYVQQNSLSFSNREDIEQIVTYCNSLYESK